MREAVNAVASSEVELIAAALCVAPVAPPSWEEMT